MKLLKIISLYLGTVSMCCLYMACSKSNNDKIAAEDKDLKSSAVVQVYNAVVNSTGTTNVYVDGVPVTGAALTFGTAFPASGYAFKVKPRLRGFSIRSTSTSPVQAPIIFSENFEPNKKYLIIMYDTTTTAKQLTFENNIVIPSDTTARVKFANFIYNNTDVLPVDIFSKRRNQNIFSNVSRTQVTDFIPYASSVSDTLIVREAGTLNQLTVLNGFSPTPKRSYTLIYRGSHKGTRTLSSFTND